MWILNENMNHNSLYLIFSCTPQYSNENCSQNLISIRSIMNYKSVEHEAHVIIENIFSKVRSGAPVSVKSWVYEHCRLSLAPPADHKNNMN